MRLDNLLDINLLKRHIAEGYVLEQNHPTLPLKILNYSHFAQHNPKWGDGTIDYCRGLIVDFDGYIVARPFKKFHNLNTASIPETLEVNLPKTTPTITEKYDGSLGILWQYESDYGIATRGSFTSPQALWATKWLKDRIEGRIENYPLSLPDSFIYTWLFEIIYDENRIVLRYPFEGLVLLAGVAKETGQEMSGYTLENIGRRRGFMIARHVRNKNIFDCMQDNNPNEEGYVVTYSRLNQEPLKVKIKMADYRRLHRVITGMNPRSIWEYLKAGEEFDLSGYPEHFIKWVSQWHNKLKSQYDEIENAVREIYINRPFYNGGEMRRYRAECAHYFARQNRPDLKSVFFLLLDGKDTTEAIWNMIEPRGDDKSFRIEGE